MNVGERIRHKSSLLSPNVLLSISNSVYPRLFLYVVILFCLLFYVRQKVLQMQSNLHLLDQSSSINKHTVFVDTEEEGY